MKHILTFFTGILCLISSLCAQLKFAENGTVKFPAGQSFMKNSPIGFSLDTTELSTWRSKAITAFSKAIKSNMEASVIALEDSLSLSRWLFDTTHLNNMAARLSKLKDSLGPGHIMNAIGNDASLVPLGKLLEDVLSSKLYKVEDRVEARHHIYTLTREEILSKFLTSYYAKLLDSSVNIAVKRTTITDYHTYYLQLKQQYDTINTLLQRIYREAKPETIEALYQSHLLLQEYKHNSKYIKLLQAPFLKQWLWSSGDIRLNPLDFSATALMDTVPALDLLSKTFNKMEFILRNKRLVEENSKNMQKLLTTAQVVNVVDFPIADAGRNQYFLLDTKEKDLEIAKVRPLDKGEKIYIMLLNIDKGYRARYRITESKQISGKSPTEELIDTVAGAVLKMYSLLNPQIGAIGGILSTLNKNFNNEPSTKDGKIENGNDFMFDATTEPIDLQTAIPKSRRDTAAFWWEMKQYVKEVAEATLRGDNSEFEFYNWAPVTRLTFREDFFNLLKRKHKKAAVDAMRGGAKKMEELTVLVASEYLAKMYARQIAPIAIDSLRRDSLRIAQLINVMAFSSLPLMPIETTTDTVPKFKSALIIIDDKDENKEQTVVVDRISAKPDTAHIVSFTYKKGRHSLMEVSFGLSYTMQRVWVQKADGNKVTSKDERFRGVAALHFYPFKTKTRKYLYKIDEPFFGGINRINFMLGVGVPQPLDNYYLGAGYDFGPGLKLNGGVHFHKYRQYTISNDEITGDEPYLQTLFPYVSLSINPETVVSKVISVFKF